MVFRLVESVNNVVWKRGSTCWRPLEGIHARILDQILSKCLFFWLVFKNEHRWWNWRNWFRSRWTNEWSFCGLDELERKSTGVFQQSWAAVHLFLLREGIKLDFDYTFFARRVSFFIPFSQRERLRGVPKTSRFLDHFSSTISGRKRRVQVLLR